MHWRVGALIVFLARASCGQVTPEQRYRRQGGYYGMGNGSSTSSDDSVVVEYATETSETSVTLSYAVLPNTYSASSSVAVNSASNYFAPGPSRSASASTVTKVSELTTYLTVSASDYASPSASSPASPNNYAPPPVGSATASENVTFSYEPTTSVLQTAPIATTTTTATANTTCGGATLNVLDASLDWWYTETYSYAVSTLSILFNANDSQTGWTLVPATTTFNITSAVAAETCTPSPEYDTYINKTITAYDCFSTPTPVAAATTIISVNAVKSVNATTGNGTSYPDIAMTAPPAVVTIPSSAGTFSAGTPFVFFSAYEIESKKPITYSNGSKGCATSTQVYNMTKPFSFEYDGPDVNGSLLVGQDAVGDVNPAFLGVVNQTDATAGSWVAAPTVAVVVERVVVAQAVLAAHTEVSATELDLPSPTLPPFISQISPTVQSPTVVAPSAHIESTATELDVPESSPTTHRNFVGPMTFIAHLEQSDTTLILPEPTSVSSFTTDVNGQTVTAFAEGDVPPRTTASTKSDQTIKPFVAHLESSNVVLDVPVPATQTVVTAAKDGQTYTATALSAIQTQGSGQNSNNDDNNSGGGGAISGLIGAIISAAKPTNALQVLSAALGQEHNSPTASAILAGLGGSGAGADVGSAGNGGSGSNAQADQLPASPAQVLTYNGAAVTASPLSAYVVDGQTAVAGGAPITVSGTVISAPASTGAIVVGGSTVDLSGSSSVYDANGMAVTADAVQAYHIGGQTLQAGGQAVTVDGHTLSLAPGGNAFVVDGSTSSMTGAAAAASIPALTFGGKTYTANTATQYDLGQGETLTPGGSAVVSGTTLSLGSDANALVVNGQTQTLSPPMITPGPIITVGGNVYAPNGADAYNINGQMLTPGGVITVSGTTMSLASDGSAVVINGQTQTLGGSGGGSNTAAMTAPAVFTFNGQTFVPNAGSSYLISGQTLTPGGVITVSGTTISLASDDSAVVINGQTQTLSSGGAAMTAPAILTIDGQTLAPNAGSSYFISGQTLTPGGQITFSDTKGMETISLNSDGRALVVNGQTQTLSSSGAATTAPAILTIDGQTFTPNAGDSYFISGQTLTPGGEITFSGANGVETISLDSSGSVMVEAVSGHTTTSTIASSPVLTIGGQTFTASGSSYVIDGHTLVPGGDAETVTVAGHTYIVSLSPQATVLEIEMENGAGRVTATSFETLVPGTGTRGTVYMTASGSGARQTGSASAGATASTGADAGLQSAAISSTGILPLTSAVVAIVTLLLAIWL